MSMEPLPGPSSSSPAPRESAASAHPPQSATPPKPTPQRIPSRRGRICVLGILLLAATGGAILFLRGTPTAEGEPLPARSSPRPVAVATVAREEVYNAVAFSAEFRPYNEV